MRYLSFISFVIIATILLGCKPSIPSEYLQPGEMEDILYDYHIAEGLAMESNDGTTSLGYKQNMYFDAVLKKHNVTQAEFDSSMVYYVRHADKLYKIYESLAERISDKAIALGASASDLTMYGGNIEKGDTTNLWRDSKSVILIPDAPYNVRSFILEADSTFKKGDKIVLSFDTKYLIQENSRDASMYLAVVFNNDSVAARNVNISSDMDYSVEISDDKNLGIKQIKGYFLFSKAEFSSLTTLKVLALTNIRLVKQKVKQNENNSSEAKKDSIPSNPSKDSLAAPVPITQGSGVIMEEENEAVAEPTPTEIKPVKQMPMRRMPREEDMKKQKINPWAAPLPEKK